MGQSAQNTMLLKTLSKAFNIKEKHIKIKHSEDGSYQLKLKKISAETIGNIVQQKHLDSSFVDIDNPLTLDKSTIDASTTIDDEKITLPKTFNEIPLPCDCPNCLLNSAYELYLVSQKNLEAFSKKHALPARRKIKSSASLKRVYGNLLTEKKRLVKTLTAHKRNILDLIVKVDHNIAVPSTTLLECFSIDPNQVLTYKTPKNQIAHFVIPSTCKKQKTSVVLSNPSSRVDESANSTPKEIPTTKNISKIDAQDCDCILCELNSKYNLLKYTQSEYKENLNGPHYDSNQRPKKNVLRANRNRRRAKRKILIKQIDTIGKEIAALIPRLGLIVALPHPKSPSLQPTDKHNTVRYTSINNKRIEFVIPSECLNNINSQNLDLPSAKSTEINTQDSVGPLVEPECVSMFDEIDSLPKMQFTKSVISEPPENFEVNSGEFITDVPLGHEVEFFDPDMHQSLPPLDPHESLLKVEESKLDQTTTTELPKPSQDQQSTPECQCIHCAIIPLYSKLKKETHQYLSLNAKIKSLKQGGSKSKKTTAKNLSETLADIQKKKNIASYQIKKINQSIVQKINLFSHLTQPHPKRSSIAILKQTNTISYSSIDGIRIRLTLIKDCKPT